MAVRCRLGGLTPFDGQELIMKGDQTEVIRLMLNDKLFSLLELPDIRNKYPGRYAINSVRICAVRQRGSNIPYEKCNLYLCFNNNPKEDKKEFKKLIDIAFKLSDMTSSGSKPRMKFPKLDDFLVFMEDKELVFGGYYTDDGGDTEGIYRKFFLDNYLKLRRPLKGNVYNIFYDIRLYLSHVGENTQIGLSSEDIRDLDINSSLIEFLKERTQGYCYNKPEDYSVVFEAQSDMAKASYFLRCFHGGLYYDDPMGILCYRFSAFVLPGMVPEGSFTEDKRVVNLKNGTAYMLDQIQINTEICNSISEFKDWIDYDLEAMAEE